MSRSAWLAGTLAALAAGATGYVVGHGSNPVPTLLERVRTEFALWLPATAPTPAAPALKSRGPVVYYQDPDGQPAYSLEPAHTADGRDYRAVRASEDVRFGTDELEEASCQRASNLPQFRARNFPQIGGLGGQAMPR